MWMIRNTVLLILFCSVLFAQWLIPAQRYEQARDLPLETPSNAPDVTRWETKVYAPYALPNVEWAMEQMGIDADPLPIDSAFFVSSAADDITSCDVAGILKPISQTRPLTCAGAGSFHHLSYVLCQEWIDKMGIPYTIIMFDNHDDAAKPLREDEGLVHCGMWGHYVMKQSPYLQRFMGIGVDAIVEIDEFTWLSEQAYIGGKMDIYPTWGAGFFFGHSFNQDAVDFKSVQKDLLWTLAGAEGYHLRLRRYNEDGFDLLSRIPTEHVYFSVDMDVIHEDDFTAMEWDNGNMRVQEILDVINHVASNRTLLGADICGYPQYQLEIELSDEEHQRNLKAYRAIYDCLASHLNENPENSTKQALKKGDS
jgi:hypothetical protein